MIVALTEELPITLARPEDGPEMMALLRENHAENGLAPWDEPSVLATLMRGIHQQWALIGVIRGRDTNTRAGAIEASIGVFIGSWWYSDQEHAEDLWNYVLPQYRRTTHAKRLLRFAKDAAGILERPLLLGVLSTEQTAAKVRLYEREFGKPSGAMFLVNGNTGQVAG